MNLINTIIVTLEDIKDDFEKCLLNVAKLIDFENNFDLNKTIKFQFVFTDNTHITTAELSNKYIKYKRIDVIFRFLQIIQKSLKIKLSNGPTQ